MDGHERIDRFPANDEPDIGEAGQAQLDYGTMRGVIGFPLKLAWVNIYGMLAAEFGDSGVTPQRFSMLEMVACNPGRSQSELAKALGLSRPATSLSIDFWQERGCVERRPSPSDRRSFGIYLTDRGEETVRDLRSRVERAEAKFASRLSDQEIGQLKALLARLHS